MRTLGPADRAEKVARLLDSAVTIPVIGWEIGLDPFLNFLGPIGDFISGVIGYYIVLEGLLARVPWHILGLMFTLATVDLLISLFTIPVIGAPLDSVWKANKWNVKLIKRFGRKSF
jgi:hypothetical protein